MNYQIIHDELAFRQFLDWLPEPLPREKFYICLFARSKYCKQIVHVSSDKSQLKRILSDKRRMFNKLRQMECPLGCYEDKHGTPIPQEALAVYITPTPRDVVKATKKTIHSFVDLLTGGYDNYNPVQVAMSDVQRSKGSGKFVTFDFDIPKEEYNADKGLISKDMYNTKVIYLEELMDDVLQILPSEIVTFIETRGGMHVCVDVTKLPDYLKKTWYNKISSLRWLDQAGDQMIPMVGCYQGGWVPRFVTPETFLSI